MRCHSVAVATFATAWTCADTFSNTREIFSFYFPRARARAPARWRNSNLESVCLWLEHKFPSCLAIWRVRLKRGRREESSRVRANCDCESGHLKFTRVCLRARIHRCKSVLICKKPSRRCGVEPFSGVTNLHFCGMVTA